MRCRDGWPARARRDERIAAALASLRGRAGRRRGRAGRKEKYLAGGAGRPGRATRRPGCGGLARDEGWSGPRAEQQASSPTGRPRRPAAPRGGPPGPLTIRVRAGAGAAGSGRQARAAAAGRRPRTKPGEPQGPARCATSPTRLAADARPRRRVHPGLQPPERHQLGRADHRHRAHPGHRGIAWSGPMLRQCPARRRAHHRPPPASAPARPRRRRQRPRRGIGLVSWPTPATCPRTTYHRRPGPADRHRQDPRPGESRPRRQRARPAAALGQPAIAAMAARLATPEGIAAYRQRGHIAETPHGDIKHNMGFRQFCMRGKPRVGAEWIHPSAVHNLFKAITCGTSPSPARPPGRPGHLTAQAPGHRPAQEATGPRPQPHPQHQVAHAAIRDT